MAQTVILKQVCPQCNGDGIFSPSSGPQGATMTCNWPGCVGTGYIDFGTFLIDPGLDTIFDKCDKTHDKCKDIMDKCKDILDAVLALS